MTDEILAESTGNTDQHDGLDAQEEIDQDGWHGGTELVAGVTDWDGTFPVWYWCRSQRVNSLILSHLDTFSAEKYSRLKSIRACRKIWRFNSEQHYSRQRTVLDLHDLYTE